MSNKAVVDYLTKQLYIERTIVTYRSLSRELNIHVNVAKNELAKFHAEGPFLAHPVESFATYLVTGELYTSKGPTLSSQEDDEDDDNPYMDDDEERNKVDSRDFEYGDSEPVQQIQMSLVSEENLELTKARYRTIYSIHVYSLTPSPLREPRLICTVAEKVYEADSGRSLEMAAAIGRIINPMIKEPIAGPSKAKERIDTKRTVVKAKAPQIAKVEKQQEKLKEEAKHMEKAKEKLQPAKLDFFKPKAKETIKETSKADTKAKTFFSVSKKEVEQKGAAAPEPVRGTKRKSIAQSTKSESESEDDLGSTSTMPSKAQTKTGLVKRGSTTAKPTIKVKRGVIVSDEEDDVPRISRRKSRLLSKAASDLDSGAEKAARALMDIDDEHVTRATHSKPEGGDVEKNENTSDVDIEMEDEETPKAKPKQRKARKVVPVGRNGLKKTRVMKSRTKVDEKGYMVTEDYSSYESVAEDESAVKKGKGKGVARGKGKKGQASLAVFFGPAKGKR